MDLDRTLPRAGRLAAMGVTCLLLGTFLTPNTQADTRLAAPDIPPGRVISWGGPEDQQAVLTPPTDLVDALAIAAGDTPGSYSNLALRADGTVVGWGLSPYGEATPPADLKAVAIDLGAGFGVALRSDGTVATWGSDESGQLDVPDGLDQVTAVSAGGYLADRGSGVPAAVCGYGLALKDDGTVVRWGADRPGLGCNQLDDRMNPPADLADVITISAGPSNALALHSDGTVVAWGPGVPAGGDGTPVTSWSDVVAVSAGNGHSLGLRADGTVLAYGIWGESGPPRETGVTGLSAANLDLFRHSDGTITVYRGATAPAGSRYEAVAAGSDYGLAIVGTDEPPAPLLGSAEIQPEVDSNPSGTAEAFQYTAAGSGPATAFHVYLDERSEADQVIVAVYADKNGEPGQRLATGRSADLFAGWNSIPLTRVEVTSGERYWLALLSPVGSGVIQLRDRPDGVGGPARLSGQLWLTARHGLPATWRTGHRQADAPASAYLS
jgi:hypothetical protein